MPRKTAKILEDILHNTHTMIAYLDPAFNFIMVNNAYAAADNHPCDFFTGKNHFDLYPDKENEKIFTEVVRTSTPYFASAKPFTYHDKPERGTTFWDWSLTPTRTKSGKINGLVLSLIDVTPRVRLEEKLNYHQQQLSALVETKTADLRKANEALQEKISELELAQKEVEHNKDRYRRITEATSNYIYTVQIENGQPVHTTHRPACVAVTGYTDEEFNADPYLWIKMVPDEDHPLIHQQVEQILQGKTPSPIEHRIYRKDGTLCWISNTPVLSYDLNNNLISYEGVVQDITKRKRAEYKLQEAYDKMEKRVKARTANLSKANTALKKEIVERLATEKKLAAAQQAAEKANRTKSLFMANMSHEIRTPMNAIIGLTDITLNTDLNDSQHRYLQLVRNSADGLLELINDILDFSKIEAGQIHLEKRPFNLQQTLESSVQALAMQAHAKSLEILYRTPLDLTFELIGDSFRLQQVLLNLLGNALKFTFMGQVLLEAQIESENDSEVEIHFTVTDTGIGINPDKLEEIFGSFTQADTSTTRVHGGTGLGLAISKKLVGIMDGKIWVESEPNKGSVFHFTTKYGRGSRLEEPEHPILADGNKSPIMIVNNNPDGLSITRETIASWGLPTLTASNRLNAAKLLKKSTKDDNQPCLIIIDEKIGTANGVATMNALRKKSEDPKLPFLLLTALPAYNKTVDKCHGLENAVCLPKPATQRELSSALTRLLNKSGCKKYNEQDHLAPDRDAASRNLRILLVEDNQINSELAQIILERAGHRVTLAENGFEALTLLSQATFDVVLMDIQMPLMDGICTTRLIRQCEQKISPKSIEGHKQLLNRLTKKLDGIHIPIIAMTAHAMEDDQNRCIEAGMDRYVSKPFIPEQVLSILSEVTGSQDNTAGQPASARNADATDDGKEQNVTIQQIKTHLATAYRLPPTKINQLLVASSQVLETHLQETERALGKEDANAVTHSAHTLKGILLNLGIKNLAELAARIETNQKRKGEVTACIDQFSALQRELKPLLNTFSKLQAEE